MAPADRLIVVREGTPELIAGPTSVSNDVCCVEIQEGCASQEPGDDKLIDGIYDQDTETCSLTYVPTTIYKNEDME